MIIFSNKKKLERNKLPKPLFDAKLFTKSVESAYILENEKI